ncbi:MAG: threonine/serine dehydratase [Acidobacteria bacterium]|nr:threonine/serine dehydratase [Acidobacteriota bacterium]MBS1864543.1 threonine/serine dehydratase [Acidobacteriota bacterium]
MSIAENQLEITRDEIRETYRRIAPYIRRTPVVSVASSDFGLSEFPLSLKLELLQHTGSFKARGAVSNLLRREIPKAGIVAASGGNHGVAVAFAAHRFGKPARIYVPTVAAKTKIARIRSYGAELVVGGDLFADAYAESQKWAEQSGAMMIHPFDQRETMLGQGTVGLELEEQVPELDTLLVAVGGGGLIGGIASWDRGKTRIVGVEPERAPTLTRALEAGRPVDAEAGGIAAGSLAPRRVGELMFPLAQKYVERVVLVSDDEIRAAQQLLWTEIRVATEPGGAAALAALASKRYQPKKDERVAVLVCGGNTDTIDFANQV